MIHTILEQAITSATNTGVVPLDLAEASNDKICIEHEKQLASEAEDQHAKMKTVDSSESSLPANIAQNPNVNICIANTIAQQDDQPTAPVISTPRQVAGKSSYIARQLKSLFRITPNVSEDELPPTSTESTNAESIAAQNMAEDKIRTLAEKPIRSDDIAETHKIVMVPCLTIVREETEPSVSDADEHHSEIAIVGTPECSLATTIEQQLEGKPRQHFDKSNILPSNPSGTTTDVSDADDKFTVITTKEVLQSKSNDTPMIARNAIPSTPNVGRPHSQMPPNSGRHVDTPMVRIDNNGNLIDQIYLYSPFVRTPTIRIGTDGEPTPGFTWKLRPAASAVAEFSANIDRNMTNEITTMLESIDDNQNHNLSQSSIAFDVENQSLTNDLFRSPAKNVNLTCPNNTPVIQSIPMEEITCLVHNPSAAIIDPTSNASTPSKLPIENHHNQTLIAGMMPDSQSSQSTFVCHDGNTTLALLSPATEKIERLMCPENTPEPQSVSQPEAKLQLNIQSAVQPPNGNPVINNSAQLSRLNHVVLNRVQPSNGNVLTNPVQPSDGYLVPNIRVQSTIGNAVNNNRVQASTLPPSCFRPTVTLDRTPTPLPTATPTNYFRPQAAPINTFHRTPIPKPSIVSQPKVKPLNNFNRTPTPAPSNILRPHATPLNTVNRISNPTPTTVTRKSFTQTNRRLSIQNHYNHLNSFSHQLNALVTPARKTPLVQRQPALSDSLKYGIFPRFQKSPNLRY